MKFVRTKGQTTYSLPDPLFEKGYLFSARQMMQAMKRLGFEKDLLQNIEQENFRIFSIRCLELPLSKLSPEQELNLYQSYISLIDRLIIEFGDRLEEDCYALAGFAGLKDAIKGPTNTPDPDCAAFTRLIKALPENQASKSDESIILKLMGERGHDNAPLTELLEKVKPLNLFKRLCNALDEGKTNSWNEGLYAPVRVAKLLKGNPDTDITPEVLKTIDRLLVRSLNTVILESIRENFLEALKPRPTGFEGSDFDEML